MVLAAFAVGSSVATAGLEVRNCNLLASTGQGTGAEEQALQPVPIVGARNGSFSGKIILTGAGAGLRTTSSDLKGQGATIDASHIMVRYAVPWGSDLPRGRWHPRGADILLEAPPAQPAAELPVWITVRVPKDAKAGSYRGEVTLADDAESATVPIHVQVADWTLPDARDYVTWVDLIQSPDVLALEYDLELWSDKHWEMIDRSLELIADTGCRIVYIPLVCQTNWGNEQSMVRWISRGKGRYEHDFSIMERYLDLACKHMGRPEKVVLFAWDICLSPPRDEPQPPTGERKGHSYHEWVYRIRSARWALRGKGPLVTLLNSANSQPTPTRLPRYEEPEAKELWQPVFSGIRERMSARGLEDAMMLGMLSDYRPTREETEVLNELSGGLPWASHSHAGRLNKGPAKLHGLAEIGYDANAWDYDYTLNPAKARTYGWKRPVLIALYRRMGYYNTSPPSTIRLMAESNISGNQRGVGRIGADFWKVIRDDRGVRAQTVTERYLHSQWRHLDIESWVLAPGLDGPVASVRYEYFREGVQECEARIFIERALTDDALRAKLGGELASRCQQMLDERHRAMWKGRGASDEQFENSGTLRRINACLRVTRNAGGGHKWFVQSGWQERTALLFKLAGEVAAKLEGR
jgi:hypothetical protein